MGTPSVTNQREKRVLIRADGSNAIGLGHIYRMKTLAESLVATGYRVAFVTVADDVVKALLKEIPVNCYFFHTENFRDAISHAMSTETPHLLIYDALRTSEEDLCVIRKGSGCRIVTFDDTGAGLTMADAVINPMVFCWGEYRTSECRARLFEGPDYMILPTSIGEYIRREKPIRQDAIQVFCAYGGTDTYNLTERTIEALNLSKKSLMLRVNLGPGVQSNESFSRTVANSQHCVKVIKQIPNLFEEFWAADVVLCAGGLMVWELAAIGTPSIAIAAEAHEERNLDFLSRAGTTVSLGYYKNVIWEEIPDVLSGLLTEGSARIRMSHAGRKTVDGKGLTRVLEIVRELAA